MLLQHRQLQLHSPAEGSTTAAPSSPSSAFPPQSQFIRRAPPPRLARFVMTELEALAARGGYTRVYLTTGPRQPKARHLYLTTGYQPQFDLHADPETLKFLPFTKELTQGQ